MLPGNISEILVKVAPEIPVGIPQGILSEIRGEILSEFGSGPHRDIPAVNLLDSILVNPLGIFAEILLSLGFFQKINLLEFFGKFFYKYLHKFCSKVTQEILPEVLP